ncbi:hypothetical protein [Brasilonema sp. UFV-L1]
METGENLHKTRNPLRVLVLRSTHNREMRPMPTARLRLTGSPVARAW